MTTREPRFLNFIACSDEFTTFEEARADAEKRWDPKDGSEVLICRIVARARKKFVWERTDHDE